MQFIRKISTLSSILRPSLTLIKENTSLINATRRFSVLNTTTGPPPVAKLLDAAPIQLQPAAGFKVRVNLKKRCKDCYFVRRQNRLYVICPTHRRHKQMEMVKDERNTWILTHATQSKVRGW